ncbi:YbaB/EbfC family nucleoid-associated protein [Alteraurantiacibacter aquimixticola]|uniref:Nucleoid-associated protein E5222_05680 n=1 Tax=Alteraurantiacibacter aquimixticola TaxID=2489173 RepID=A0A4V4U8Z1_9SPHN|nr:YbaB/EbfC family nucleoid-associated protein [Alteraurantiacibacter aquimixticola]TIX51927.1 YbaB/EbfC family nucleoid-associated protein [Alteraurantiacibacter aquimixticola]
MESMEEMLKAAQEAAQNIQKQMSDAQVKLDSIEVEGSSGGGLVKIRATAKGRILGVNIDDSLMVPEEKQILEDLVTAAFNDARDKADRAANEQMKEIQGSMGLPPGFNLPGMG